MAWVMVPESRMAGAAYKPSALGAHTGSFFLFSHSVMIYTQFPPLMGCIWSGILFGLMRLPIPSSSWVPLAILDCGIFPAREELCDLTATSWLIKARKWSAQNTWIASPFQHQPVSNVGRRLPEMPSNLSLYHTEWSAMRPVLKSWLVKTLLKKTTEKHNTYCWMISYSILCRDKSWWSTSHPTTD